METPAARTTAADATTINAAVAVIQKRFRHYCTLNNTNRLIITAPQLPVVQAFCLEVLVDPQSRTKDRSSHGMAPVYLPPELPTLVVKHLKTEIECRLQHKQLIRAILTSQQSRHLVIPRATSFCGEFLVEERLPINTDPRHNMQLYSSNLKLFDRAVQEMTNLFGKIFIEDLMQIRDESKLIVRYDNMPLMITEDDDGMKTGKIGLIDLGRVRKQIRHATTAIDGMRTIISMFPMHVDLIIATAKTRGGASSLLEVNAEVEYQFRVHAHQEKKHFSAALGDEPAEGEHPSEDQKPKKKPKPRKLKKWRGRKKGSNVKKKTLVLNFPPVPPPLPDTD